MQFFDVHVVLSGVLYYPFLIGTARIVCGTSVYATVGRPSVSVPFTSRTPQVCCCGPRDQETSIDCCTAGGQQQRRHSAVRSSKCGECYVVSWRRKLNTDLFQDKIGICVLCGKCHQKSLTFVDALSWESVKCPRYYYI